MIPTIHEGHRMRIAREEAGLEVREIAERIGIAPGTVIRYEKGRSTPKPLARRAWAEVTGVPAYWLQWGTTEAPTQPPVAAKAGASIKKLPRLDSNQQPAD
ncbi:helix-turn-helix domain-containing protein [Demequina gelatinilytica]|uniref:helix-turn-helix domain-containing protein n=1 Tax=Demequina gelatinilytica TaxID=1638980 RepID=UPI0009E48D84